MKKYIIYIVFFSVGWQSLSAQEILIQWTGVVRNELMQPVPFAHVIVQRDLRGTVTDHNGMFTIVTYPNDTLFISCVGYKIERIPVPNFTVNDPKHFIQDVILEEDVIGLSEVYIFPWRTYMEFREAFMALELPEDDLQRVYRNIAIMQQQINNFIANRPTSPNANFRDMMNSQVSRMMTYGHMFPTYSITNPIAWAQFFQALQRGDFRRREEDNNERSPSAIDIYQENVNR